MFKKSVLLGVFVGVFVYCQLPIGHAKKPHIKAGNVDLNVSGKVDSWFMGQTHPYFSEDPSAENRIWAEFFGYFNIEAAFKDYKAELRIIGERTSGRDPYGTYFVSTTDPVGDTAPGEGLGGTTFATVFDIDRASLTIQKAFNYPIDVTLGRQEIKIGDGFIVADGVFDTQAVYYNPRNGFDAARMIWSPFKNTSVDFFASYIDPTNNAEGSQKLYGVNVTQKVKSLQGRYDLGWFYRQDNTGSDRQGGVEPEPMMISLRAEQGFSFWPDFNFSGEWVVQWGDSNNIEALTTQSTTTGNTSEIEAFAGHATARYTFSKMKYTPFFEASYVHFSGDNTSTGNKYEGYTPLYPGFMDWNKWFMGDVMSYTLYNTNERIAKFQLGGWPRADLSLRAFYMKFWLDKKPNNGSGGHFADEVDLVLDYFPNEHVWLGALAAVIDPANTAGVANVFNFNSLGTKTDVKGMLFASFSF